MRDSFYSHNGEIIDYYRIFNLPKDADKQSIRSAFCSLVKHYHPDISGIDDENVRKKINLIINGYKILIDDAVRNDYNLVLKEQIPAFTRETVLPKNRIRYSISLKKLLMAQLLGRGVKRRKDRRLTFGHDLEILVFRHELICGAKIYIDLPAKMYCPICWGKDYRCWLCKGLGRINSTSILEVSIPSVTENGSVFEFDLTRIRPDNYSEYSIKRLCIKIVIR